MADDRYPGPDQVEALDFEHAAEQPSAQHDAGRIGSNERRLTRHGDGHVPERCRARDQAVLDGIGFQGDAQLARGVRARAIENARAHERQVGNREQQKDQRDNRGRGGDSPPDELRHG